MRLIIAALAMLWGLPAVAQADGAPTKCARLTVAYGTVFKYNSNYPTTVTGDIWFNTWDRLGRNITATNDTYGWNATGGLVTTNPPTSNFAISQLSTTTTATVGTSVNTMPPWGYATQQGADTFSFKAGGIISVNNVLYVAVNRATNTTPSSPFLYYLQNMQLIKSTDDGATWVPQPTSPTTPYSSPMFSGYQMGNADFLQYGQNYQGQTADNSATWVYAYATEGPYNNANYVYLARVKAANIANQSAADWTYYQGGDGMLDANWSSTWPPYAVMNGTKIFGASVGTQYFPSLGCYVRLNWWYPSVTAGTGIVTTSTYWQPWAAPHPWGPWYSIGMPQAWATTDPPTPGMGLFSPHIMPASVAGSSTTATAMALCAGDYNHPDPQTGSYTLTMVPITLTQN